MENLEGIQIPLEDAIVLGHNSPDHDSVCSGICLTKFLIQNGKFARFYIQKNFQKELEWILLENKEIVVFEENNLPLDKITTFYVLDCSPDRERMGINIPKDKKIINIDHHASVLRRIYPNKKISYGDYFYGFFEDNLSYIENCESTCSILNKIFGIKDPLLGCGIYFDTLHLEKNLEESIVILSKLDIENGKLKKYISKSSVELSHDNFINFKNEIETLTIIDNNVCLFYNKNKNIDKKFNYKFLKIFSDFYKVVIYMNNSNSFSVRSKEEIDLTELCSILGGGGHKNSGAFKADKNFSSESFYEKLLSLFGDSLYSKEDAEKIKSFYKNYKK